MAREHLSVRQNWQGKSAARGAGAEDSFTNIMTMHLEGTEYRAEHKPRDLNGIYGFRFSKGRKSNRKHGILPEFVIRNNKTEKAIFVEIKRQRAAGNAHERACKFMMPGILESMREIANVGNNVIPFWWVFTNGIASDPNYRQEIMHWFRGIEPHVLLWDNVRDIDTLRSHFEKHIKPLLS